MRLLTFLFRVLLGGLVVGHGTQKLFGWFGGHGLEGTAGFFESLGLRPGKRHATAAGASEVAGGTLLVLGLGTPLAAAALTGVMAIAIKTVHVSKGPWNSDGGWEFNAVIIAALALLVETGPGELSLDHALGIEASGPAIALAALGAGLGGAALNLRSAEQAPPAPQPSVV